LIQQFELKNGSIVDFMPTSTLPRKVIVIKKELDLYVKELVLEPIVPKSE